MNSSQEIWIRKKYHDFCRLWSWFTCIYQSLGLPLREKRLRERNGRYDCCASLRRVGMEPIPMTSKKLLYYSSSMNSGYRPGLMPAIPRTQCSMSKIRALTKLLLCATILFSNLYTLKVWGSASIFMHFYFYLYWHTQRRIGCRGRGGADVCLRSIKLTFPR
jgi:hypothetical protein